MDVVDNVKIRGEEEEEKDESGVGGLGGGFSSGATEVASDSMVSGGLSFIVAKQLQDQEAVSEEAAKDTSDSRITDEILPNVENAYINPDKLTKYALNPKHSSGCNKARVFESALGYNLSNATELMQKIYDGLPESKAILGEQDKYGQRYTVDIEITGPNEKTAIVRTGWIIKVGSSIPELTTLFVH